MKNENIYVSRWFAALEHLSLNQGNDLWKENKLLLLINLEGNNYKPVETIGFNINSHFGSSKRAFLGGTNSLGVLKYKIIAVY